MSPSNPPSSSKIGLDIQPDAHSAFLSSSRRLIETTRKKLNLMNGMSDELRFLTGQIEDDRVKKTNEKDDANGKCRETVSAGDTSKSPVKQNIKVVVPVCPDEPPETNSPKNGSKSPRRKGHKRTPRFKKDDAAMVELARRHSKGKQNHRTSRVDPLKYLEIVENSKKDRQKLEGKDLTTNVGAEDHDLTSGDEALCESPSADVKSPRESVLPVIEISRRCDRQNLVKSENVIKCANCSGLVTCEKQRHNWTGIRKEAFLKLCQKHNCTRHSAPESTEIYRCETKNCDFIPPIGCMPLSWAKKIHTSTQRMRTGTTSGRVHTLSCKRYNSNSLFSQDKVSLALTPERFTCPRVLCFGTERINSEYLAHRQILRPNKVTLQSSDASEVAFLPLDEISVGFRFRLGKKPTFPLSLVPYNESMNNGRLADNTLHKSKTFYSHFHA